MSTQRRTLEFKLEVVQHFIFTSDGQKRSGARFGIDKSHVRNWANLYKLYGLDGLRTPRRTYIPKEKNLFCCAVLNITCLLSKLLNILIFMQQT